MIRINNIFRNQYLILGVLIIFGLLVRLYKVSSPIADWHSWRQADTASVSKIYINEGGSLLFPRYYDISSIQTGITNIRGLRMVEFPFFNIVHVFIHQVFPQKGVDYSGRLSAIIISLISSLFIYLIGKKMLGTLGGLLSAFFYLFIPYSIYFSRAILPEPIGVMFVLIAIYLFILSSDSMNKTQLNWTFILSSVFFAMALLIKPFLMFYILPLLYFYFTDADMGIHVTSKKVISFMVYFLITIFPFSLWRIWVNNFPQGIPFFEWAFNGNKIRFRPSFFNWIFIERIGKLILGVWGMVFFGIGLLRKNRKSFVQVTFFGALVYLTVVASANVMHDYYQILIIPALCFVLANGVVYILENKSFNRLISYPLIAFSIAMMLLSGIYQVKEYYLIIHPEIIEMGKKVDEITPKNARIIAPYNGDTAFLYQTGRYGWPAVDNSFDNLINVKGADYYVTVDPKSQDSLFIGRNYKIIYENEKGYFIADLKQKIN